MIFIKNLSHLTLLLLSSACVNLSYAQAPIKNTIDKELIAHPIYPFITEQKNCKKVQLIKTYPKNLKIMHIDLDYIYDKDPHQLNQNLNLLIKRIQIIQPNTVLLQAFADPDGNGSTDQLYFQNRHLPVRQHLLHPVIQAIHEKTAVELIFAWLPLLAFEPPKNQSISYVQHSQGKSKGYIRLSPFDPNNLKIISEIYADFAKQISVDGILFHDDITLNDYEDSSAKAVHTYQKWGFEKHYIDSPTQAQQLRFAQLKTQYLDQLAYGIKKIVQCQQPQILTARNSYAPMTLNPVSEQWLAQSLSSTFKYYDFNAIMAMPYMEKAINHQAFYTDLVKASKTIDPQLKRTIFELQTKDWSTHKNLTTKTLIQDMTLIKQLGVKHIGYYPDDFLKDHPEPKPVRDFFKSY